MKTSLLQPALLISFVALFSLAVVGRASAQQGASAWAPTATVGEVGRPLGSTLGGSEVAALDHEEATVVSVQAHEPLETTVGTKVAELEKHDALMEEANARIRGGRIGVGLSSALAVGGAGSLIIGLYGRSMCEGDDNYYGEDCSNGALPAGIVMMLAGVALTGVSAWTLRRGKRAKRHLEDQRVETALRLGPTSAGVTLRF